ncbi:MAG: hypothetical protein JO055_04205 [Alphaproteobacteria bacterium]|nr:hypothetical protein [Alphaproteobacteria bacterium]
MPAPLSREHEWDELVRANQTLQRKYSLARDENDLVTAALYKKRWTRQQDRMRAFLAQQRKPQKQPAA